MNAADALEEATARLTAVIDRVAAAIGDDPYLVEVVEGSQGFVEMMFAKGEADLMAEYIDARLIYYAKLSDFIDTLM